MWFVFDAYEPDLAWLRVGQEVSISVASLPGKILQAPIAFIDPNLNEATRTAKVRVVVPNYDHALLHKQTAYGTVRIEVPSILLAPRSAILQHGGEPVAYVEQGKSRFAAHRVRLGRMGDHDAEILGGLAEGDRVVTEGALILDGQAQLARSTVETGPANAPVKMETLAPALPVEDRSSASLDRLKALALASAEAADVLAADNFDAYRKILPQLRTALHAYLDGGNAAPNGPLAKFKDALPEPADLRAARRDYEVFSTALTDVIRERKLAPTFGLHVYQCPMAPVLGTARWLSRNSEPRNPFFGSAMPVCGDEVK
jgi:Cu(I)/Ag(I) efflux system membrane fusion protein